MEENSVTRRSFFKFALAGAAVVPFVLKATNSFAADKCPTTPPAGKPMVNSNEGMGKSFQYVADATTSKHAKYKAGSHCANCKFFNANKGEGGYAPCTMMGMKWVTNCGWCTSYAAKA